MTKIKHLFSFILLGISVIGFSQNYSFKREISLNSTTEWNRIEIPMPMYQRLNKDLSDLRIYQNQDNQETPFLLSKIIFSQEEKEYAGFKILNRTKTTDGHYITLEAPAPMDIEEIALNFANENFDWKISLEGSHDQKQWFSILQNYRILAIKNTRTNYTFQQLAFEKANYTYYRIFIPTQETPIINDAQFQEKFIPNIEFNTLKINNISQKNNQKEKNTIINFSLPYKIPVMELILYSKKDEVFKRPIEIKYLINSTKTEKGIIKNYDSFYSGEISYLGIKDLDFSFYNKENIWAKDFQITIDNQDNTPIKIDSIKVHSPKYFIFFKPKKDQKYTLFYGNKNAHLPEYDIKLIEEKVFKFSKSDATLSEEEAILTKAKTPQEPLFKNKWWLWGTMFLIISILGYFSYKMFSQKEN